MIDSLSFYNKIHLLNTVYGGETFEVWLWNTKNNVILYKNLLQYVKSLLYFALKMWFNLGNIANKKDCSASLKCGIWQTYTKWQFPSVGYINNEYFMEICIPLK